MLVKNSKQRDRNLQLTFGGDYDLQPSGRIVDGGFGASLALGIRTAIGVTHFEARGYGVLGIERI